MGNKNLERFMLINQEMYPREKYGDYGQKYSNDFRDYAFSSEGKKQGMNRPDYPNNEEVLGTFYKNRGGILLGLSLK
ncbi:hypothetical protein K0A97_02030 [Patescibacteria group bacterium]|nr:hypothetical protein [Patescibacteria group bacterium]